MNTNLLPLPTFSDIADAIHKLVLENPTNKYNPPASVASNIKHCYYNEGECDNKSIGCIIGQAFKMCEYPIPLRYERRSVDTVLEDLGIDATEDQKLWLCRVQASQDCGDTWSIALSKASS